VDLAALLIRVALGITMLAHGYNHAFGGGKLAGTARWFESIGIRPGRVHALLATLTELTAHSVARALRPHGVMGVVVSGGGVHNPALMAALRRRLDGVRVVVSD